MAFYRKWDDNMDSSSQALSKSDQNYSRSMTLLYNSSSVLYHHGRLAFADTYNEQCIIYTSMKTVFATPVRLTFPLILL